MEHLHPGARWVFRFQTYFIFLILGVMLTIGSFVSLSSFFAKSTIAVVMMLLFLLIFIVVLGEFFARLGYKNWKYEFTKTNLKIEKGIIWKKYSNIPYERVQNVDVQRGILARMLGFSTVNVQTAGYSGSYGSHGGYKSEGHLPAISINGAEKIREFLMKKIGRKQGM